MLPKLEAILKKQLSDDEATRILRDLRVDTLEAQDRERGPGGGNNVSKTRIIHKAGSGNKCFDQVCVSMDCLMNITLLAGEARLESGPKTLQ